MIEYEPQSSTYHNVGIRSIVTGNKIRRRVARGIKGEEADYFDRSFMVLRYVMLAHGRCPGGPDTIPLSPSRETFYEI